MKYLTIALLILSFNVFAQEKEGDLQLPVTDLTEIERQEEEELPPTIEEVEMKQKKDGTKKEKKTTSDNAPASP